MFVAASDLETEHLEHEIELLAARVAADTARWLELVAEFDRRNGWWAWGMRSCAHWLSWRCALSLRAAREHVRVARSLAELPEIAAAFARGELSYSKARALTRVATGESEAELLELASHATAAQLELLVRSFERVTAAQANDAHERRYLTSWWDEDGSLCLHARLPAEQGRVVERALEQAHDELWDAEREREEGEAECSAEHRRLPRPNRTDALALLAERSLDAAARTDRAGRPATELVVHVDLERLAHAQADGHEEPDGRCHLDGGPAISAETARRLGCDAHLAAKHARDGRTLSIGRRKRVVPAAMRRALTERDSGCRFPGCHNRRFVDAHHIRHWAHGGETSLENLVLLCTRHHRLVHEGGFGVERAADGSLRFRHPAGYVLDAAPCPPALPARHVSRAARRAPTGPLRIGSGERMELRWAVEAMVAAARPRAPR